MRTPAIRPVWLGDRSGPTVFKNSVSGPRRPHEILQSTRRIVAENQRYRYPYFNHAWGRGSCL